MWCDDFTCEAEFDDVYVQWDDETAIRYDSECTYWFFADEHPSNYECSDKK